MTPPPPTDQDLYRKVGARIKDRRSRLGLTQEGLAGLVGLSRTSVVNIEAGRQRLPLHVFVAFTKHLQATPADLLPEDTPQAAAAEPPQLADESEEAFVRAGLARADRKRRS